MRALETRLLDDLRALRIRDPIGAVWLVAPSRLLGVHIRRRAGRALGGVFNVEVLTLPDLAERVTGDAFLAAGRRPLPPVGDRLVIGRAIREAIPEAGGYFSGVRGMRNFPAALQRTLLDLKRAGLAPEDLVASAPAGGPGAAKLAEVAACVGAVETALAAHRYHDVSDLFAEAVRRLAGGVARPAVAAVCVFGFVELNPLEARLLDALDAATTVLRYPADEGAATLPPLDAVEIVAAPGEEREIREIARVVLDHVAAGGRFEDVGILLRQPGAYRAIIRDVFDGAGIPYGFGVAPSLAETRAGRTLRLLLDVRRAGFSRTAVMECLGHAELADGPGVAPAEWDRLSRQAGIVGGAQTWRRRLAALERALVGGATAAEDEDGAGSGRERDREAVVALRRVIGLLTRGLGRLPDAGPLAAFLGPTAATFRRLLAPAPDVDAALAALAGLAALGPLQPEMSLDEFRGLVEEALARPADTFPPDRSGRVFVGELGQSVGLPFPLTVLPGLVEGGFPPGPRPDPILRDEERRRLTGLPLAGSERGLDRLRFRLAVGSGAGRVVLTYPRVDAGSGRVRVPSFFLLDLLSELTGVRHDVTGFDVSARHRRVPLRPAPPAAWAQPVDEREWLVSRGLASREAPEPLLALLPGAARGTAAIEGRERALALTAWDGLTHPVGDTAAEPLAPTALETYATCPFRFLLARVLRLRPVEEPDQVQTIGAADRGSLVHAVLERTFRRLQSDGALPLTPERLPAARRVLDEALEALAAAAETRGVTGLPALWAGEKARIRTELLSALEAEAADPAGWVPTLFELAFGLETPDAAPALIHALADGRTVRFRGKVDRVDRSPDGNWVRVVDYKTGRVRGRRTADRLEGGRALQLPVYRLAVEGALAVRGEPAAVDEAQYYHVIGRDAGTRVRFTRAGWASRRPDFDRIVGRLLEGIAAGCFFARPETCASRYPCEFDLACGAERLRWSRAKAADPAVVRHAELDQIE